MFKIKLSSVQHHNLIPPFLNTIGYSYTDEDVSDAAPLATTFDADDEEDAEEVKGAASLQFMITNRMRRVLEDDLNYHEEEIDMMDPQIASVVIERGLARPLTGMPKSWYKILPSKPILSGLRESVTAGSANFNRVINFTIHKILPFAIPAAGFVYAAPKLFQLLMRSYSLIANFSNKNLRKVKEKQSKQTFSRRVKPEISGQSSITRKNTGVRDGLVGKVSDRVDMKALNSINRSSTFFERIMGK